MDSLVCVVCVSLIWVITAFLKTATTSGGGGWGRGSLRGYWYSGFQVTGMIKWGQKEKEKNPWTNIPPPPPPTPPKKRDKIPSRDTQKLSGIFKIPKRIPYANQGTKKNTWIFLSKFQTQTILWSFPSYEIWSTPQGRYIHHLSGIRRYMLGKSYDLKETDAIK